MKTTTLEIDRVVNKFSAQEGVNVFASQSDTVAYINRDSNEQVFMHKMTLFYNGGE